jgi:hypothetical protein
LIQYPLVTHEQHFCGRRCRSALRSESLVNIARDATFRSLCVGLLPLVGCCPASAATRTRSSPSSSCAKSPKVCLESSLCHLAFADRIRCCPCVCCSGAQAWLTTRRPLRSLRHAPPPCLQTLQNSVMADNRLFSRVQAHAGTPPTRELMAKVPSPALKPSWHHTISTRSDRLRG